jgi:hypothetical protein
VPVTVDNFDRAESDMYFATSAKEAGGVGKLLHRREVVSVDKQPVVRANRDTLYSSGVFDLDAGPVTITLPDAGNRFMSMQAFNEDHYVVGDVIYGVGSHTYDKEKVGTRYMLVGIRTLVDPNIPKTSSRSTICKARSRSIRKIPASWNYRTGIQPARRRCATLCSSLTRP